MPRLLRCLIAFAILAACRTTGVVAPEYIQSAEAAIHDAEASGAAKVTDANSYLQTAREELKEGKELSDRRYGHRAELVLDRAAQDAKLSSTIAQKSKLDSENAEISKQLSALP